MDPTPAAIQAFRRLVGYGYLRWNEDWPKSYEQAEADLGRPVPRGAAKFNPGPQRDARTVLALLELEAAYEARKGGVARTTFIDSRGEYSRNDIASILSVVDVRYDGGANADMSLSLGGLKAEFQRLENAGDQATADRLRRHARPLFRHWVESQVPSEVSTRVDVGYETVDLAESEVLADLRRAKQETHRKRRESLLREIRTL